MAWLGPTTPPGLTAQPWGRVVDWALQSATLGAGRPGALKVVGLQARSSPFVAILPATADCVESAATAALDTLERSPLHTRGGGTNVFFCICFSVFFLRFFDVP